MEESPVGEGSYFALRRGTAHQNIWKNINHLYIGRNFYGNHLISVDRKIYYSIYSGNVGSLLMIGIYMKYMLDFILLLSFTPTVS